MRYYRARQREHDHRWDFTCGHGEQIFPVGYCHAWKPWNRDRIPVTDEEFERYNASRDKYHTHGHKTAQEAANCYRDYLLDTMLNLNTESVNQQMKCEVCGEWTTLRAHCKYHSWVLCEKHRNRAEIEKLFHIGGDSEMWQS